MDGEIRFRLKTASKIAAKRIPTKKKKKKKNLCYIDKTMKFKHAKLDDLGV